MENAKIYNMNAINSICIPFFLFTVTLTFDHQILLNYSLSLSECLCQSQWNSFQASARPPCDIAFMTTGETDKPEKIMHPATAVVSTEEFKKQTHTTTINIAEFEIKDMLTHTLCPLKCVTCVTAHCAAAIAVLATVAALTLLPSVKNTSLAWQRDIACYSGFLLTYNLKPLFCDAEIQPSLLF